MTINLEMLMSPSSREIKVGLIYNFLIRTSRGLEDVRGKVLTKTATEITIKVIEE